MEQNRIGLALYAVRHVLNDSRVGYLGVADFMIKHRIPKLEINNTLVDPAKFKEITKIFTDRGIIPTQLTIDGNNFFQRDDKGRKDQMIFMQKWLDLAHSVGIKNIRANMGYPLSGLFGFLFKSDTIPNLVATFSPILEYLESLGMKFGFENHGGKSSNIAFQLDLKQALPSKNWGYLLDFGNYHPKSLVYDAIPRLGSAILMAHAKGYSFDSGGNETTLDYPRIIKLLNQIGYNGDINIEFEGPLPDFEGVEKTLALLQRC
jgi:sugar phosphate isomerase/epimerase